MHVRSREQEEKAMENSSTQNIDFFLGGKGGCSQRVLHLPRCINANIRESSRAKCKNTRFIANKLDFSIDVNT